MFGTILEGGFRIPVSLGGSTIRRLIWGVFSRVCKEEGCVGMWKIRWDGQSQRMVNLLSNLSIRLWSQKD